MREGLETAAQLDRAIDELLCDDPPLRLLGAEGELTATARLLRDSLPRFHPRFGFSERLSRRLAAAAAERDHPAGSGEEASVPSLPAGMAGGIVVPIDIPLAGRSGSPGSAGGLGRRVVLVAGGAIASGVSLALPVAGAVLLGRRRSRGVGGRR